MRPTTRFHVAALLACAAARSAGAQSAPVPGNSRWGAYASTSIGPSQGGPSLTAAQASAIVAGSYAEASAALSDGAAHASVNSTDRPPPCWPDRCGWGAAASAYAWNSVTLTPRKADGSSRKVQYSFKIDGSVTYGRYGGGGTGDGAFYFGTDPNGPSRPYKQHFAGAKGEGDYAFDAAVEIVGATTFYYYMSLSASAYGSATADFGNTMRFTWSVPDDVIVESAAPEFVAPSIVPTVTTTPEPASLALVAAGVCGVALARGRRRA